MYMNAFAERGLNFVLSTIKHSLYHNNDLILSTFLIHYEKENNHMTELSCVSDTIKKYYQSPQKTIFFKWAMGNILYCLTIKYT